MSELRAAPEAVWHVSPSGLGFERLDTGDAWIWQVSDGERLVDAAWGDRNESVAFVSGRSVVVADIDLVDEDERYTADLSADAVAVTKSASGWRVLLVDSEGLSLASLDEELEVDSIVAIDVPLPGTVLNYGLVEQGQTLHVSVEGLLATTHHRSSVATLAFEQVEAGPRPNLNSRFRRRRTNDATGAQRWLLVRARCGARLNTGFSSLTAKPTTRRRCVCPCCPMPSVLANCLKWCWRSAARAQPCPLTMASC